MNLYDEDEAVAFIKKRLSDTTVSDDDILNVIDAIFDYYDDNGELDFDFDDDSESADTEIEKDTIIAAVTEILADTEMSDNLIREIIEAELAYEDSLL